MIGRRSLLRSAGRERVRQAVILAQMKYIP